MRPYPALYLVTPDGWDTETLLKACDSALSAGASWLQYRDKSADPERRLLQARALRALTREHDARLIINDDVALAAEVGACGVHLGAGDAAIADARAALGTAAIIGVSCYDDPQRAAAAADSADYLAFGAFFPSATKPLARRAAPELLLAARQHGKPLCAIGGIDAGNCAALVASGADLIAVVQSVFAAPDVAQSARELLAAMAFGWAARNATRQIAH